MTITAKTHYRKSKQIFPEKELRGLSPNFPIHVSVSDLYIPRIGPHTVFSCSRITVSFLGICKWEPDIYIGFSLDFHLQCAIDWVGWEKTAVEVFSILSQAAFSRVLLLTKLHVYCIRSRINV